MFGRNKQAPKPPAIAYTPNEVDVIYPPYYGGARSSLPCNAIIFLANVIVRFM